MLEEDTMPKKPPKEAGTEFINELLSKHFSAEDQEKIKSTLLAKEAFVADLGNGTLMQSDYNRNLDELRDKEQETQSYKESLDQWYAENVKALEAAQTNSGQSTTTTVPAGQTTVQTPAIPDLKDYIKKSDVEAHFNKFRMETEQRGAALIGIMNNLSFNHFRDFKETLDVNKLYDTAAKKQITLDAAYHELTKDLREELLKKQREDEKERLRKEIKEEVVREMRTNSSLPYAPSTSEPSTLSGLGMAADKKAQYGTQAAIDEFYRMQTPR